MAKVITVGIDDGRHFRVNTIPYSFSKIQEKLMKYIKVDSEFRDKCTIKAAKQLGYTLLRVTIGVSHFDQFRKANCGNCGHLNSVFGSSSVPSRFLFLENIHINPANSENTKTLYFAISALSYLNGSGKLANCTKVVGWKEVGGFPGEFHFSFEIYKDGCRKPDALLGISLHEQEYKKNFHDYRDYFVFFKTLDVPCDILRRHRVLSRSFFQNRSI